MLVDTFLANLYAGALPGEVSSRFRCTSMLTAAGGSTTVRNFRVYPDDVRVHKKLWITKRSSAFSAKVGMKYHDCGSRNVTVPIGEDSRSTEPGLQFTYD